MKANQYFSRTIKSVKVTVMTVNSETAEVGNAVYMVSQLPKKPEKLLADLRKAYETDSVKIVSVVSTEEINKLMGITEEDFFAHAVELDPETRKPYTDNQ